MEYENVLKPRKRTFFWLGIAVMLIYSNSYRASWHLDDWDNIVRNPGIQISVLSLQSIGQTFFAPPPKTLKPGEKRLYRPLPMMSFALNWYFGGANVGGYHLVNIMIHVLTAWMLYLTILLLMNSPSVGMRDRVTMETIAFLAAFIWAIHPIHTQAVTYIVQRMTSLSGLFCISAIYSYGRARLCGEFLKAFQWFSLCVLCFTAACLSKENAITLIPILILLEFCFFRDLKQIQNRRLFKMIGLGLLVLGMGITIAVLLGWNPFGIMDGYKVRSFTPGQRILTQFRVLWIYIQKLFIPLESFYSIDYDVLASRNLIEPWSTLLGLIGIASAMGLGLAMVKKRPLICFPIFFFFLAHSVEASFLPLELVFEHRNYFPSMFLFLPLAVWLTHFLREGYNGWNKISGLLLRLCLPVLFFSIALATYSRNFDWQSEVSLWRDAMEKAPQSARTVQNYAYALWRFGTNPDWNLIEQLFKDSAQLRPHKNKNFVQSVSYINLSALYGDIGEAEKELEFAQKASEVYPNYKALIRYLVLLLENGKDEQAFQLIQLKKEQCGKRMSFMELEVETLLRLGKLEEAGFQSGMMLRMDPLSPKGQVVFSKYLMASGQYGKALLFLRQLNQQKIMEGISEVDLLILECLLRSNDGDGFDTWLNELVHRMPLNGLIKELRRKADSHFYPPISMDEIEKRLGQKLAVLSKSMGAD
ncbi:MAG: hypothetical protein MI747_21885 [Desulfobacterales bacterium]|nr:hypothetical protein [Desulfobacterales bacterium]